MFNSTNLLEKSSYTYKRGSFNPNPNSPNVFLKKLELRFQIYYKDLYKTVNRDKKNKNKN